MKYMMMFEDGNCGLIEQLGEGDLAAADDGYVDLFNLEDKTRYHEGKWEPIPPVGE